MNLKLLLTKTLLVAAGLCAGANGAWGWTTTTYDFTLLNTKASFGFDESTVSLGAGIKNWDFKVANDFSVTGFPALSGVLASYTGDLTVHSTAGNGIYTENGRYVAIRNLSPGAKVSLTFSGVETIAYQSRYGSANIGKNNLSVGDGIASGDVVTVVSGDYIVIQPNKSARIKSMTISLPDSQAEVDAAIAATGNTTYSISSAPIGGDEVTSVFGITATFGGTPSETWTHANDDSNRGWINGGAATVVSKVPTAGTFIKFQPVINGHLTISAYLYAGNATGIAYLSDGTTVENVEYTKGSPNFNGTYSITFDTELEAGKIYYVYYNKHTSSGVETANKHGFWGFTFIPTNEVIGALDKSTASADNVFGSDITISNGSAKKLTFKNHGQDYGKNWMLKFVHGGAEVTTIRADWFWKDGKTHVGNYSYAYTNSTNGGVIAGMTNWAVYQTDMDDATVELTLSHVDNNLYVIGTMANGTNIYYFNYAYINGDLTGDVTLNLSVNYSWLEVLSCVDTSVKTVPAHATAMSAGVIGDKGYSTFAETMYPLDLSAISGATAYYAESISAESVTFRSTEASVPVGEGLLLKGENGASVTINIADDGTAITGNKLVGCIANTDITSATDNYANFYVMVNGTSKPEFQNIKAYCDGGNTVTIPAGKAYLDATGVSAPSLNIIFDDALGGTTGIDEVNGSEVTVNGEYYNLAGQRVAQPTKGLYIVGGKKVIVK